MVVGGVGGGVEEDGGEGEEGVVVGGECDDGEDDGVEGGVT